MITRVMQASWYVSDADVKASKFWSGGIQRRKSNNLSLRKKNAIRRTRREGRQAVKQAAKDICAYEDNLFMDILRKQV